MKSHFQILARWLSLRGKAKACNCPQSNAREWASAWCAIAPLLAGNLDSKKETVYSSGSEMTFEQ